MLGKYSPTVSNWYSKNKDWFRENCLNDSNYDKDGFDSYGYDENDIDRAGNNEMDYVDNKDLFNDVIEDYSNIKAPMITLSESELNYNEIKVAYIDNVPKKLYNILIEEEPELENSDDGSAQYRIGNVINSVLSEYGKNSKLYQELKHMEQSGIQYIEG